MIDATAERALLARIERLEQALLTHIKVDRVMLATQQPSVAWPGSTAHAAMRKLNEAADLLKHDGESP